MDGTVRQVAQRESLQRELDAVQTQVAAISGPAGQRPPQPPINGQRAAPAAAAAVAAVSQAAAAAPREHQRHQVQPKWSDVGTPEEARALAGSP
eukprot:SAG25_NODE_1758_length_2386_cov_7.865763_1_plen_94_part_00